MQNMGIEVLFKGNNFLRLLEGLWITFQIAIIAMVLSVVFGLLMGIIMNSKNKIIVVICNVYLEMVRIMPQLVLLFLFLNISMKVDIA